MKLFIFIPIEPINIDTNVNTYIYIKYYSNFDNFNFHFIFKFINDGAIIIKYGHNNDDSNEIKLNTFPIN